ncbi:MAG: hypothetical protein H0T79_09865 [Deltaproteobacteria bacterium]|nr:hypothetical protein [Deltaproteobacteria bacterium]
MVDYSSPPSIPAAGGKADGSSKVIALNVQSPHPYTNNLDRVFAVPLTGLPSCARRARLHFKVLRTEAQYDFVTVEPTGAVPQSFDGSRDNTWTAFFDLTSDHVDVRLSTDDSITRHGFEIDSLEWEGSAICPAVVWPACAPGTADITPPQGVCACPTQRRCATLDEVAITHKLEMGRNRRANSVANDVASETHPGPTDASITPAIGHVDRARLVELVEHAAQTGVLATAGYDRPFPLTEFREELTLTVGVTSVTFVAGEGTHDAAVTELIAEFEALFRCDNGGGVSCDTGFECLEGACVPAETCICPAIYQPVCGVGGHTYSNTCAAGCANAPVAHDGECGIAGDSCGTLAGLSCTEDNKCRYDASTFLAPWPDAGGTCVAPTYCDAPTDCNGLPHVAVPGSWRCTTNTCGWQAGALYQPVTDGRFETAHPYASSTSVWMQLYLPSNAQALHLVTASFRLENNYDFLEVWTWKSGAWARVGRYTGTAAPTATTEFPGQYHYLRFVSDSSVNDQGFVITAEYR